MKISKEKLSMACYECDAVGENMNTIYFEYDEKVMCNTCFLDLKDKMDQFINENL